MPGRGPALRASRPAAPPPGLYAALSSSPSLSGLSLSSHSTFHAAGSLSCERQRHGRCAPPRALHLAHPALPSRAHLAHGHTFVSPRALGSRRRRRRRRQRRQDRAGSTVAVAAGWPAGHGGRWGRRADETSTHPGNEQGEGRGRRASSAGGRGRRARQTKAGARHASRSGHHVRGPAPLHRPAAGAPRHPLCVAAQGAGARGRATAARRRPDWGRPAARHAHPRHGHLRHRWGETPAPPQGPSSRP